ncbi:MAG: class I SAM-dependent methyltransferase [Deltaproteobacteria bacterium]|nr:class I SAM-dependent methyltransferase [Deltaproteobacteria bacterium]
MQQYLHILSERKKIWKSKKILKRLYRHWYCIIGSVLRPGSILEIGGGSGNFKEFSPDAISSDIIFTPWTDAVLDAHHLPFQNESLDNIVLFDVLHHLINPGLFFYEAQRVLKQKGKIVLMEPYISWVSFFVYRFLHTESIANNHLQGNQAIPTLIFERDRQQFVRTFPRLKIIRYERMDFVIYPLSGGFHNPSFCPLFLYNILEYLEKLLNPLNRFLAFRLFVVLEKT